MLLYLSNMYHESLHPHEFHTTQPEECDLLLINVPATYEQGIIPDDEEPPFGLMRVATYAESQGHKVAIMDAHGHRLQPTEVDEILYDLKPRTVGLNPTSVNVPETQEIAEICARRGIPLIIGGVHATLDPLTALTKDFPMAYAAVRGRGEAVTPLLLNGINGGKRIEADGLYYQGFQPTDRTDFAPHIPLEKLPPIDQRRWVNDPITSKHIVVRGEQVDLREMALYETAGCPFECTFCATPVLSNRGNGVKSYHRPPMERIIASLQLSISAGANGVHFIDDMAFATPEHFREFAKGVHSVTTEPFYWRGMTRAPIIADHCTDEDIATMANSGCWRITMGVESGSDSMLKQIRKKITKDQVRRAIVKLRSAGISEVKAFFIMGFPGETADQLHETQQFIHELKQYGLTDISLFQFKPYPGTFEWKVLEQTQPHVLDQLSYVGSRVASDADKTTTNKKISEVVWLPDDLQIAAVPSGEVKSMVIQTLRDFYQE